MYTDKKNVLQLVTLLRDFGITHVVCCPGSRNAPIISAFAECEAFECHSVVDERSAGFMAIGMAQQTRRPVAVCVTSGSALLNLHPAVAEAFYQQVPLVVISADRPAAWIGQMDGQTLPQVGVFGSLVRQSVQLPEVNTDEDEWYCNRLINEALLLLSRHTSGPVHINVPLSEPLFRYTTPDLPNVRKIKSIPNLGNGEAIKYYLYAAQMQFKRPLIIIGQTPAAEAMKVYNIPKGMACVAELPGNTPDAVRGIDVALHACGNSDELRPDLVITCGGHIVSKRLKSFLRNTKGLTHWHISPDGEMVDLFCALQVVFETTPKEFFDLLSETWSGDDKYASLVRERCAELPSPTPEYSELAAVKEMMKVLPEWSVLHLANSSAIRLAELFPLRRGVEVCANRGVNGIEGSLSTAIGYAACDDRLNVLLIGDLSFFYDMNALRNEDISHNLRIVLLNNGGGAIFRNVQGMEVKGESGRLVTATHGTSAEAWARALDFAYLKVTDETSLQYAMIEMTCPYDRPVFIEVFTHAETDAEEWKRYYEQIKK